MDNQDFQRISDSSESMQMYTFQRPYPQQFCFQTPITKYILKYSTGKVWKKLIQTCKYFYSKNPIYPAARLEVSFERYYFDRERMDRTKPFPNFWLYDYLFVQAGPLNTASLVCQLITKNDLRSIHFNHQNFSWEEYQIFASSDFLKMLTFCSSYVQYSDGTYVTVDKLLERLETVEKLVLYCKPSMVEPDTIQKMLQILPRCKNLKEMHLDHLTENFDIASFVGFIMTNQNVKFVFSYIYDIPASYREMLENFIDQILENPPINVPRISWRGQNTAKYKELVRLHRNQD